MMNEESSWIAGLIGAAGGLFFSWGFLKDIYKWVFRTSDSFRQYEGVWYGLHYTQDIRNPNATAVVSHHTYSLRIRPGGTVRGTCKDYIEHNPKGEYESQLKGYLDERRLVLDVERRAEAGHHKLEIYYTLDAEHEMKGYIIGKNFAGNRFVTKILMRRHTESLPDHLETWLKDTKFDLWTYP